MICAAAAAGCGVVLKFKPYIANRFAAWQHVWEFADTTGYQQTRTMSAAASGGLFGNGADNGWLKYVGASNTDLVFGMVAEELGLIVAVLTVVCIVTFSLFTIKAAATSRSTFYTIAACATCRHAGVPDHPQRAGFRGPAAPDRRNISLPLLRRIQHDSLLGPAGFLSKPEITAKIPVWPCACRAGGRTDPLRRRRRSHAGI